MKNFARIIFGVILFSAVFYAPWWLLVLISIVGTFLFPRYVEVVAFGFLYDVLYGTAGFAGATGVISSVVLLFVMEYVKKEVRA